MKTKKIVFIFFIFVLIRFVFLISYDYKNINGDQKSYHSYATKIKKHGLSSFFYSDTILKKGKKFPYSFGRNPVFWEPLYNLFVSTSYSLIGVKPFYIGLWQLFLSILSFFVSLSIIKKIYPEDEDKKNTSVQEIFLWFFALYISLAGFVPRLYPESIDVLLLLALFWFFIQIEFFNDTKKRLIFYFSFGVVFALYLSIKSYWSLMVIPFSFLILFILLKEKFKITYLHNDDWEKFKVRDLIFHYLKLLKANLFKILMILFIFNFALALIIIPVQIRTYIYSGQFSIATKTAYNLWKDNNNFSIENHDYKEKGAEKIKWLQGKKGYPDKNNPPRNFGNIPLAMQTDFEKQQALNFLFTDPVRFFKRAIIKNINFWSPNTYVLNPVDSKKRFHIKSKVLRGFIFHTIIFQYIIMMFLFFIAIVIPSQNKMQSNFKLFFITILIYTTAIISWGHGQSRYRIPLMPEILMLSAFGFTYLKSYKSIVAKSKWRKKMLFALSLFFILIIIEKRYIVAGIGRSKAYYFAPTSFLQQRNK